MCGEQEKGGSTRPSSQGSPPRVRGTGCVPVIVALPVGITPACAGNRPRVLAKALASRDHPRVCGEQKNSAGKAAWLRGSPPRVRGTVAYWGCRNWKDRITPACAGNSYTTERRTHEQGDHPRVCGEQWPAYKAMYLCAGSPPRVRGTVLIFFPFPDDTRITPACAGNRCNH